MASVSVVERSETVNQDTIFYPLIIHPLLTKKFTLKMKFHNIVEYIRWVFVYSSSRSIIEYPWRAEGDGIKERYLNALETCCLNFCHDDLSAQKRLDRFKKDLMATQTPLISEEQRSGLSHISASLRLFAFRYVFLFDCVYLMAPSDPELARRICTEMKQSMHQKDYAKMEAILLMMEYGSSVSMKEYFITAEQQLAWIKIHQYVGQTEKRVILTATMSAGKSTLLNAIIGQELAFAKKAACTATVMEFRSAPVYHTKYNVVTKTESCENQTPDDVKSYTRGRIEPCCIIGYFESCINSCKFSIFDTPGVNSSRNPLHKTATKKALLDGVQDVVVYVIPVETYGSEDDYDHLNFICKKVNYKSILFVVNMMDTCDPEDDSITEIIENVSSHLVNIGFCSPRVCPVSAKAGLLMKQALTGKPLSKDNETDLLAMFAKFSSSQYDLSQCYQEVPSDFFQHNLYHFKHIDRDKLYRAYLHTGIPQFEDLLLNAIKGEM